MTLKKGDKKMKKVLVVEDRTEFMAAAKDFFAGVAVEVTFVSSYEEAKALLKSDAAFDMALIDVFMPSPILARFDAIKLLDLSPDDIQNRAAGGDFDRFMASVMAIMADTEESPVGLLLYGEAKSKGVKTLLVTSLWHHSEKFEAVYRYLVVKSGRFYEGVEGSNRRAKAEYCKDCPEFWAKAYEML